MIFVSNLTIAYGDQRVLEHCSLHLDPGEHAALMGPSGCGKTTLLRAIAGLLSPGSGTVTVNGRLSYVFQEPRLFPSLTAEKNVATVMPKGTNARLWLKKVGLEDAADKYPAELSGGMQQRLNLCRALAYGGDVLLLDEPFRGLDLALRREMLSLVREEWADRTLLLVTHEADDAEALGGSVYEWSDHSFTRRT